MLFDFSEQTSFCLLLLASTHLSIVPELVEEILEQDIFCRQWMLSFCWKISSLLHVCVWGLALQKVRAHPYSVVCGCPSTQSPSSPVFMLQENPGGRSVRGLRLLGPLGEGRLSTSELASWALGASSAKATPTISLAGFGRVRQARRCVYRGAFPSLRRPKR